ncbi:MAG: antA/AntB antirepressor family protein [Candidatus Abawacabacteria bacterium]|nr:antA/AntB antirepressor family protein [Candidatus Abawacabacteria bacterium]
MNINFEDLTLVENGIIPVYALKQDPTFRIVIARDVHAYLETGTRISDWFNRGIETNKLVEGENFGLLLNFEKYPYKNNLQLTDNETFENIKDGRPRKEYWLTVDAAKVLVSSSHTEKGLEARWYFVKVEEKLLEVMKNPRLAMQNLSKMEILEMALESERQLEEERGKLLEAHKTMEELEKQIETMKTKEAAVKDMISCQKASKLLGLDDGGFLAQVILCIMEDIEVVKLLSRYYCHTGRYPGPRPCFSRENFEKLADILLSRGVITKKSKEAA